MGGSIWSFQPTAVTCTNLVWRGTCQLWSSPSGGGNEGKGALVIGGPAYVNIAGIDVVRLAVGVAC